MMQRQWLICLGLFVGGIAFIFKGVPFWLSLCCPVCLSFYLEFLWKRTKKLIGNRVSRLKKNPKFTAGFVDIFTSSKERVYRVSSV